jgi:hypothetical protein
MFFDAENSKALLLRERPRTAADTLGAINVGKQNFES